MAVINENYMEMKNLESRNIQPKNSEIPIPNEQDNLIAGTEEGNRKNKNEQREYNDDDLEQYSNMGVINKPPKPGWKGKLDIIVSFMEIDLMYFYIFYKMSYAIPMIYFHIQFSEKLRDHEYVVVCLIFVLIITTVVLSVIVGVQQQKIQDYDNIERSNGKFM